MRRRRMRWTDVDKRYMGKKVWYHTFNTFKPELVSQGFPELPMRKGSEDYPEICGMNRRSSTAAPSATTIR